jgi:hypothetical protein
MHVEEAHSHRYRMDHIRAMSDAEVSEECAIQIPKAYLQPSVGLDFECSKHAEKHKRAQTYEADNYRHIAHDVEAPARHNTMSV